MKYWIMADTHFGHTETTEFCDRPQDFNERLQKGLFRCMTSNDFLIHLGDFCFGNEAVWHERILASLPGKKILVRGNHDKKSDSWYLSHWWDFVVHSFTMEKFGFRILFSHMPMAGDFDINIHGHFHNISPDRWEPELKNLVTPKHRLLAVECTNYQPVNLETFCRKNALTGQTMAQ